MFSVYVIQPKDPKRIEDNVSLTAVEIRENPGGVYPTPVM